MAERAALVTGGSSGIGLAIARALGEDGYGVTISARRPEKLEAAAEELARRGARRPPPPCPDDRRGGDRRRWSPPTASVRPPRRAGQQRRGRDRRADGRDHHEEARHPARREPARPDPRHPRGAADAARGRRRARQGADRQHGVDRRQERAGVAVGLLGDQGGGGRLQPGDAEGVRRPGDPGDGAVPGVRRHADDRVRPGAGGARRR